MDIYEYAKSIDYLADYYDYHTGITYLIQDYGRALKSSDSPDDLEIEAVGPDGSRYVVHKKLAG